MAYSMFVGVLSSIPNRKELQPACQKTADIISKATGILEAATKDEYRDDSVSFALRLITSLRSPLEVKEAVTMPKRRERIWKKYAHLRAEKLPAIWSEFLQKTGCGHVVNEPLVMELINESIFEKLIADMFTTDEGTSLESLVPLTKDEENIIRYACGYVGMKLHKKFLKVHGDKAARFVECLDYMHADGTSSSLLEYTTEWVQRINRGGLFDVSDDTYRLFVAIETVMSNKLSEHLKSHVFTSSESDGGKSSITEFVISNPDVQFYWSIISINIEDEDECMELLKHIIELWLNIRGFSVSKAWMENYKHALSVTTKQKKSLRKELKKNTMKKKRTKKKRTKKC